MRHQQFEFSFVVPLHNTGSMLRPLLGAFRAEAMTLRDSWELVLVDDGSTDGTPQKARELLADFPAPVVLVVLAKNFGEHAAVFEGWRRSHGRYVVNLDDDLQNPVSEARRLLEHLRSSDADVAYTFFDQKKHAWWRNLGSQLANVFATLLLEKPHELYLSSFRAVRRELIQRVENHHSPFLYLDGLIFGATNRFTRLKVIHKSRLLGCSGYTMRKLLRLAGGMIFGFSMLPLRIASMLGLSLFALGLLPLGLFTADWLLFDFRQLDGLFVVGCLAVFGGMQLLLLGIVGEYVGRTFLTVINRHQVLVREVFTLREVSA